MLTSAQIRGARAMLRWSASKLSEMSGVSLPTISRMELSQGVPKSLSTNLQAIQNALEDAGVIFIDEDEEGPGVRLRKSRDQ
jgi:transcriptional regulator with XRE-family HTH domain